MLIKPITGLSGPDIFTGCHNSWDLAECNNGQQTLCPTTWLCRVQISEGGGGEQHNGMCYYNASKSDLSLSCQKQQQLTDMNSKNTNLSTTKLENLKQ